MKLSELVEKIKSLVGDIDPDIYICVEEGVFGFTDDLKVKIDIDGDITIGF